MEVRYVAIDPGDSTGWATFNETGGAIALGTLWADQGKEALYEFLKELPKGIDIICENYFLYPDKAMAQSWSPLDTVRAIGTIEFYAYLAGSSLHHQPANIKSIAYKWAGIAPAKNHKQSHELDAYVHGVYYLQKNGIRRPQQGKALA